MCIGCWDGAEEVLDAPEFGGKSSELYARWALTDDCLVVFTGYRDGRVTLLVNGPDAYTEVRVQPGDLHEFGERLMRMAEFACE